MKQYNINCNIAQTLNIIGDRWSLLILHQIFLGFKTYKEILDELKGIPTNLLSHRLKSLESEGLLFKSIYNTHPPRYEYNLTEKGYDLEDVFNSLILWGEKHISVCYKQLSHKDCGGKIRHLYYCPQCKRTVNVNELIIKDESEE